MNRIVNGYTGLALIIVVLAAMGEAGVYVLFALMLLGAIVTASG